MRLSSRQRRPTLANPALRPSTGRCPGHVGDASATSPAGALRLYDGLGFVRDKRLHKYYLNGARGGVPETARDRLSSPGGPQATRRRRTTPAPLPLTPPRPTPCAGNDAYRLKVWFNSPAEQADKRAAAEHAAEPGHEAAPTEAPAIAAM